MVIARQEFKKALAHLGYLHRFQKSYQARKKVLNEGQERFDAWIGNKERDEDEERGRGREKRITVQVELRVE